MRRLAHKWLYCPKCRQMRDAQACVQGMRQYDTMVADPRVINDGIITHRVPVIEITAGALESRENNARGVGFIFGIVVAGLLLMGGMAIVLLVEFVRG